MATETKEPTKTYIVGKKPIAEAGEHFAPKSEIKLTDKRAKALGKLVTPKG